MEIKWHSTLKELPPIKESKKNGWHNYPLLLKIKEEETIQILVGEFDRTDGSKWEWKIWVPCLENRHEWNFVNICPPCEWAYIPEKWFTLTTKNSLNQDGEDE